MNAGAHRGLRAPLQPELRTDQPAAEVQLKPMVWTADEDRMKSSRSDRRTNPKHTLIAVIVLILMLYGLLQLADVVPR